MIGPVITSADLFLLERWQEDSPLSSDAQRERIFADYVALGVDGQQRYKDLRKQRGCYASSLTPEEQQLLDRVRLPIERFTNAGDTPWLRTCYEPSTEPAFLTIASELEPKFMGQEIVLNDPALYDFGKDWHRVFYRIPQLLEVPGSAKEYHESLHEALHPEPESEASDAEDNEESEDERDYTAYHWALVVGRIHIVDHITLASEGRNASKVLIVFYDVCGRVVRSYRESVEEAANISCVGNSILYEQACWDNGKIGKEYRWGAPLGPPYGPESDSNRDGSESGNNEE